MQLISFLRKFLFFICIYFFVVLHKTNAASSSNESTGVSLHKTTNLKVDEKLDAEVDNLVYKPKIQNYYSNEQQYYRRQMQPVYYQQPTYVYFFQ